MLLRIEGSNQNYKYAERNTLLLRVKHVLAVMKEIIEIVVVNNSSVNATRNTVFNRNITVIPTNS
jgi:hypothetical protein